MTLACVAATGRREPFCVTLKGHTRMYQLSRETLERFADGAVRRTLLPFKILATGVEYFIDQHGKRISSDGKVNTDFPD